MYFCSSNRAKFVFDLGYGVDIIYFWCLAEQCDIFDDILVSIGSMGGSSDKVVNSAIWSVKKRGRGKGGKGVEAATQKNITNQLLEKLIDRGSNVEIATKNSEINLHRSTLNDLTSNVLSAFRYFSNFKEGYFFKMNPCRP